MKPVSRMLASAARLGAAALLAGSIAAGCERAEGDAPGGPVVGFSQIGAESAWRTAETESIRSEAAERGIDLRFSDAQGQQENQIRALRGFIAQKVDVIVLAPVKETGWEPILREAKAAGIPVVLVDRGVEVGDDSLYATLIASDFVEEGRMAGRWVLEATGGEADIAELRGTPGAAPAIDRRAGFSEVVDRHEGLRIIASQSAAFTRAKGKEVMETFLKAHGDAIDVVYAHNDDMALGAIQAIEEAGLKPGEDILIVSIDGVRDAFRAMVDGTLNATVECNPLLGPLVFDTIEALRNGDPVEKWVVVEDRIFTRDQAADLIDSRAY